MTTAAPTSVQIDVLLQYLEEHTELARGFLRSSEGRVRSKVLWENLTDQLNALGGAHKTVKQWQKVWSDRKYLAKKAAAASRQSARGTGGGPSTASVLTDTELRIVNIMGEGFGEPDTFIAVPAFPTPLIREKIDDSPSITNPLQEEVIVENYALEQTTESPRVPQQPTRPQRRQRVNRRHRMQDGSVRSRFFRMEEERVAAEIENAQELRAIRQTLERLVNLFESYIAAQRE